MPAQVKNLLANYSGQCWTAICNLLIIPIYIRLLGLEQYGLISIFLVFQACLPLLDLGLSQTLTRQISTLTPSTTPIIRHIFRTIEISVYLLSLAIFLLSIAASGPLSATLSSNSNGFDASFLAYVISLMGLTLSFKLVESLYRSVLVGSRQHVLLNSIQVMRTTAATFGSLLAFQFFGASIFTYLVWQILISIVTLSILAIFAYSFLKLTSSPASFRPLLLLRLKDYTVGMILITLLSLVFTQFDKLVLVRLLSLSEFASYSIAFTLASSITLLVSPITVSYFPAFCNFLVSKSKPALRSAFHISSQLVSVISSSLAVSVAIYAYPILRYWTNDIYLASSAAPVLQVLSIATLFNTLLAIPYQLQLAYGWTSLGIRINLAMLLFFVPSTIFFASIFGSIGAAFSMLVLNIAILFCSCLYMFSKILKSELRFWVFNDLLAPLLTALLAALTLHWFLDLNATQGFIGFIVSLSSVFAAAFVSSLLSASLVRKYCFRRLHRFFRHP